MLAAEPVLFVMQLISVLMQVEPSLHEVSSVCDETPSILMGCVSRRFRQ